MKKETTEYQKGLIYIISVYTIWGMLPAFWKLMDNINSFTILAHRIIWSFVLISILVWILYKPKDLWAPLKDKKNLLYFMGASIVITINWGTYIWAIVTNHLIETSMGYYINPLVTILLSMIIFKEKMNTLKKISIALAFTGVFIMILGYHKVPVLALTIAFSFASYGVIKKKMNVNSLMGLFYETAFILPIALSYVIYLEATGEGYFISLDIKEMLLLIGSGAATSIPLLLFASATKRINFSMVGFMQYIAPTITLIMGVFIYSEHFDKSHWVTFGFIWAALAVYTVSNIMDRKRKEVA